MRALRARGPAGPAATPPSFGCDHLRGGRAPLPTPVGGAVLAPLYKGRRRRRGPTRRAARPPQLRLLGPRGPARTPGLPPLDHGGGGCLRSTPQARGAAAGALLGARPASPPLRFSGPVGPARIPRSFPPISASPFVRAGRPGPPLRRRLSAVTTSGVDACPSPPLVGGAVLAPLYKGRHRRRGPTRRAARASSPRLSGPVGPARIPGLYPHSILMQESKDMRERNIEPEIYRDVKVTNNGWCVLDHESAYRCHVTE